METCLSELPLPTAKLNAKLSVFCFKITLNNPQSEAPAFGSSWCFLFPLPHPLLPLPMFNLSLCNPSIPCSTLWHHRAGERPGLHGAGLETADLHRWHGRHRLLCGLPRGGRRRAGKVAWGERTSHQWEGLQGEWTSDQDSQTAVGPHL